MTGLFNISEALSIAIHLCVRLAQKPGVYCSTRTIAESFAFSQHHAAKVVQKLARGGLIDTVRGVQGGARLSRDAGAITLLEIADAINETPPAGCLLKGEICSGDQCMLGRALDDQNRRMQRLLAKTTLKQIVASISGPFGGGSMKKPGARRGKEAS